MVATIKAKLESSVEPETPEVKAEMDKVADEVIAAENANTDSIDVELDSKDKPKTPESSESAENAQIEDSADLDKAEPESEEMPSFTYTETDAAKAKTVDEIVEMKKACREEIARLEKTRLKHATYKQNRELDAAIWKIRRIMGIAFKREVALKERARRIRNAGRVSSIALKRARFVKLMRQGISITNITNHPEGVKKEELVDVLDEATIEACKKNNSRFPAMWLRWKEKFIDKKDDNK